jgi:tyrosyl-tRNA synthetase
MCERYLKVFTLLSREEISAIISEHEKAPNERAMQKTLAKEATVLVHSKQDYETAQNASRILFANATQDDLQKISADLFLSIFEGVPKKKVSFNEINGKQFVDVAVFADALFPSKSEVRRNIAAKKKKKKKITDEKYLLSESDLLHGKYILLQKGKKNYFIIEAAR